MKLSAIAAGIATMFVAAVSGQYAIVKNDCTFPIWLQSFPYDGSANGPLTELNASSAAYVEAYHASGSTIKIGKTSSFTAPLFFGYSLTSTPNLVYYEFSSQYGNPFIANHNVLAAGKTTCAQFNCAANNSSCYSTPSSKKVYTCGRPTSVQATICSP